MANVSAILLGKKLETLREDAGMTQEGLGNLCGWPKSKVSKIENGKQGISQMDVYGLCSILGVPEELRIELQRVAAEARKPGWWQPYKSVLLSEFSTLLDMEQLCSGLCGYEGELIHGLLQTAEYARSVQFGLTDAELDKAVNTRLDRQRRFWARKGVGVRLVMHESALTRPVCGPVGDKEQLEQILHYSRRPKVGIRVVPASVGAHPSMTSSYMIVESDTPGIASMVYTETLREGKFGDDVGDLERHRKVFSATYDMAIPVKEWHEKRQVD